MVEVFEAVVVGEGVAVRVVTLTVADTVAVLETVEVTDAVCENKALALLAPELLAVLEGEVVKEGEALAEGEPVPAGVTVPPRSAGTQSRRRKTRHPRATGASLGPPGAILGLPPSLTLERAILVGLPPSQEAAE